MKDFPSRLKKLRGAVNQAEFAETLGISTKTLSRYELGSSLPDLGFLDKVCAITGVDPKWLMFGEGSGPAGYDGPFKHDGSIRHDGSSEHPSKPVGSLAACPLCIELAELLGLADERLYEANNRAYKAMESKESLVEKVAALEAENIYLREVNAQMQTLALPSAPPSLSQRFRRKHAQKDGMTARPLSYRFLLQSNS